MVARDTPQIRVTRCRPQTRSVEGEARRLVASGVPTVNWQGGLRADRHGNPLDPNETGGSLFDAAHSKALGVNRGRL
jgi:hypothetical protein